MASRLNVTELDFDTIKTNLKDFLKQQSEFTDYDFEGSGMQVLLDILAYNTHYNAYYLNMLANESFLDTAQLRDSVVSHAKNLGYIPRSASAAKATLNFTIETNDSTPGQLTIPRGYVFRSNLIDNKFYNFVVLSDVTATKANTKYYYEELDIYEGELVSIVYTQNNSTNPKQAFTIPSEFVDTTSINVTVTTNSGGIDTSTYIKVENILDVDANSAVFFVTETAEGKYRVSFGDGVVGKQIPDNSVVTISYLVTNGELANFADSFVMTTAISGYTTGTVEVLANASGGGAKETVDSIKFNATSQFATQNRLITFKDYETYILQNYSKIDSISVWGGEDNDPPVYGKVFVSMKPKSDYYISEYEKQRIIDDIIKPVSIVAVQTEIVDPEYLYINSVVNVQYDKKKTTLTAEAIKTLIRNTIISYKNANLNKFGSKLIHSKLEKAIDGVDLNSIIGSDSTFRLEKRFEPSLGITKPYQIKFNTKLHRGTIANKLTSSKFNMIDTSAVERTVFLEEIPQSYSGLSAIRIVNAGYGYTTSPTITITGDGIGATAEAVVVNGKIESINITSRGINYTRAIITITGGGGSGASATAEIDSRVGTLQVVYFDTNAEKQIVDSNAGTIDYDLGVINLNDINIISVQTSDGLIRMDVESEAGIVETNKSTILTIDDADPTAVTINLTEV